VEGAATKELGKGDTGVDLSKKGVVMAVRHGHDGASVRGERVRQVHELLQDSGHPLDLRMEKRSR
jgi:hypothetical protein